MNHPIDRLKRHPRVLLWGAVGSWCLVGVVIGVEVIMGWRPVVSGLLSFPVFVLTLLATVAAFDRDPEQAGHDALRGGLLMALIASFSAGWFAMRIDDDPTYGGVVLIAMACAMIGVVVGALIGPTAGWAVRDLASAARGLIRGADRR